MRYSPEALTAFVETVAAGSFSAAARRLRKSQSTISTSIANLEADLGFELFDRSARHPVLTAQGEQVLGYVLGHQGIQFHHKSVCECPIQRLINHQRVSPVE